MAQTPPEPKKTPIYRDLTVLQLAALVFVLDQFSKYLVIELLPFGSSFPARGLFRFTHAHNTGSAFGIFQGQNTPLIFVSIIGIIILVMIYRSQPRPNNWLRLSLGLQFGGALGNLLDRLRLGFVTDFIDIGPWPVFNLADASIVTGLLILAWIFLRPGRSEERKPVSDAYSWCPVCEGDMVPITDGWRCTTCGVKERIDESRAIFQDKRKPSLPGVSLPLRDGDLHEEHPRDEPAPALGEDQDGKGAHQRSPGRGEGSSVSPSSNGENDRAASVSRQEGTDPSEPEQR